MRLIVIGLFLVAPLLLADDVEPKDPNAPVARAIDTAGLKLPGRRGALDRPTKITTQEELKSAIPDADTRAALLKKVDLKKEYLLLFAWSGSGGDRVSLKVGKGKSGPEAVFSYARGRTRDLRQHAKLFAIPAKTTYRMAE